MCTERECYNADLLASQGYIERKWTHSMKVRAAGIRGGSAGKTKSDIAVRHRSLCNLGYRCCCAGLDGSLSKDLPVHAQDLWQHRHKHREFHTRHYIPYTQLASTHDLHVAVAVTADVHHRRRRRQLRLLLGPEPLHRSPGLALPADATAANCTLNSYMAGEDALATALLC